MMQKHNLKTMVIFLYIASILAAGLFVLAVYNLYYPLVVFDSIVHWPGLGGGCDVIYYDPQGNRQIVSGGEDGYKGDAPLYEVDLDAILDNPVIDKHGCLITPETLDAEIVLQGQTMYPAQIHVTLPEDWVRAGSSFPISATVNLADMSSGYDEWLPVSTDEHLDILFHLENPNFDFTPSNEDITSTTIPLENPASQLWILAPKERSMGEQILLISIDLLNGQWSSRAFVTLEVRPLLGLDPILLAFTVGIGNLILWVITITATVITTRKSFLEMRTKEQNKTQVFSPRHRRRLSK